MPPLYEWQCEHCGEKKEVLNSFDDYNKPPEESCKTCEETRWKKIITKPPQATKGGNWGGGKGSW